MTFFALFCMETGVELMTGAAGSFEASQEAVTPVPATFMNRRLVRCGRCEKVATECGRLLNCFFEFLLFVHGGPSQ